MINFAILNDYIKFNSLTSIRFKRGPRKKIEYLQPEEVKQISSHKFASSRLQQVADLFVLQCYTGFSYADLAGFYPGHLESDENGREWIIKPRVKTTGKVYYLFYLKPSKLPLSTFFLVCRSILKITSNFSSVTFYIKSKIQCVSKRSRRNRWN